MMPPTDRPDRGRSVATHEAARQLRSETAAASPDASAPPASTTLRRLQRSAGNAAVSGMLHQPARGGQAAPLTVVARQPGSTTTTAGPIPRNEQRGTPAGSPFTMDPDTRRAIEAETMMEISTAFTAFLHACDSNITAMKAAAKARAEAFALIIDIATGFLAPAFANFAAQRLVGRWAEKVATRLTTTSGEQTIALIAKNDILKAAFTGVAKVGGDQIKRNATTLFGESDDDKLLEGLQNEFQRGAVALAGRVPSMTDTQLIAVWHAYDPMYADVTAYKTQVKSVLDQYAAYVKSIHNDVTPSGEFNLITDNTRAYWITVSGHKRLALVDELEVSNTFSGETGQKTFRAWVPDMWADMAQQRSKATFGDITEIQPSALRGGVPGP
jgi:hypothetical protein